jgi:hypothetical protein
VTLTQLIVVKQANRKAFEPRTEISVNQHRPKMSRGAIREAPGDTNEEQRDQTFGSLKFS